MSTTIDLDAEVTRWTRELRKGSTRLALLAELRHGESYGYRILTRLRGRGLAALSTSEAAVYPLLHDLETRGFLTSRWKTTEDGVPPRKYYALTGAGAQLHAALRGAWNDYRNEMEAILGDDHAT